MNTVCMMLNTPVFLYVVSLPVILLALYGIYFFVMTALFRYGVKDEARAEQTLLKEFYQKIGFENIRFRPAYFPYTEPSLEIEIQWNNKWIELGGAGIFRPEVTLPFNLKEPVLAWGLGLERIAMILLNLNDIRMLYFSDISWLKELPFL